MPINDEFYKENYIKTKEEKTKQCVCMCVCVFMIIKGKVSTVVTEEASHPGISHSKYRSIEACSLGLQGILYV